MNSQNRKFRFVEMCTRNRNIRHHSPIGNEVVFVFDIDDCLYRSQDMLIYDSNLVKNRFLELSNSTEDDWSNALSKNSLYREIFYKNFNIHPSEFCKIYDLPEIHNYVTPDLELKSILEKITHRKFCFTNGSRPRAERILEYLQIDHVFEAVICADVEETEFICKPSVDAFRFFEEFAGIRNPRNVYFFDDSHKNILAAKEREWNGILVSEDIKEAITETVKLLNSSNMEFEILESVKVKNI